jgi:hypothetical protein
MPGSLPGFPTEAVWSGVVPSAPGAPGVGVPGAPGVAVACGVAARGWPNSSALQRASSPERIRSLQLSAAQQARKFSGVSGRQSARIRVSAVPSSENPIVALSIAIANVILLILTSIIGGAKRDRVWLTLHQARGSVGETRGGPSAARRRQPEKRFVRFSAGTHGVRAAVRAGRFKIVIFNPTHKTERRVCRDAKRNAPRDDFEGRIGNPDISQLSRLGPQCQARRELCWLKPKRPRMSPYRTDWESRYPPRGSTRGRRDPF